MPPPAGELQAGNVAFVQVELASTASPCAFVRDTVDGKLQDLRLAA
ncbi:MAG: hypothetical protein WAS73_12720 [Defluviicoccus sp.]